MSDNPFIALFGSPEDREEWQRQADMEQMKVDVTKHEMQEWITSLDRSKLEMFRALVGTVTTSPAYGHYLAGEITAILYTKHNVCMACMKNHDEMLRPEEEPADDGTQQMTLDDVLEDAGELDPVARQAGMVLYNMREPHEGEVNATPDERPVICRGCGQLYQSLEDRMLKAPDDCHFCHIKAAHG